MTTHALVRALREVIPAIKERSRNTSYVSQKFKYSRMLAEVREAIVLGETTYFSLESVVELNGLEVASLQQLIVNQLSRVRASAADLLVS